MVIVMIIYLCALFLFATTSGMDVEQNIIKKNVYMDYGDYSGNKWSDQEREVQQAYIDMEERSWFYAKDKRDDTHLLSCNGTFVINDCKEGGFSCVTFSTHVEDFCAKYGQTDLNKLGTISTKPGFDETLSRYTEVTYNINLNSNKLSAYFLKFSDPEWEKQWYMQDYRTFTISVMDHNVVPVFNMGITGQGVTVAIVGEGIMNHPDLGNSFDEDYSFNFCHNERGAQPHSDLGITGRWYRTDGTSNAGVIAMKAGNNICGVGIAPNVRIAGYRVVCSDFRSTITFDLAEKALEFQLDTTDIYCNVWLNYGWVMDVSGNKLFTPSNSMNDVFRKGTTEGRNNKGSIYIFPSGLNRRTSNCASNGYLNNPYVITIASANQDGKRTSYSERCTAIFATAYSGDIEYQDIATIDAQGKCSTYFTEFSAGPAIASGIIALVLEKNPSLTYRDVLHIIAMTAEVAPLANNGDTWYRNGRGFWVSNNFGFGLLNAENMVLMATDWKKVSNQNMCLLRKTLDNPLYFDSTKSEDISIDGRDCKGTGSVINYLEHVELEVTINSMHRGAIYVNLTSPSGTNTAILAPRKTDFSTEGYLGWNIMSVHNWGEQARGIWKVTVGAIEIVELGNPHGQIFELVLKLYGTQEKPVNYPRKYSAFRLSNGKTSLLK